MHGSFDTLQLWFEERAVGAIPADTSLYLIPPLKGQPNSYVIVTVPFREPQTPVVTFTTNTDLPLPDPRYLKLHAAVCRIAHMSGAAEYLETYDRKLERIMVLAQDGTSADVLSHRLKAVSLMA